MANNGELTMGAEFNLKTKLKRSSEPLQAGLDDEVVMMSVEKGSYYSLDAVGAKIWSLLEKPVQVSDLIERLMEIYDADPEICEKETIQFLDSMLKEDLVEIVE